MNHTVVGLFTDNAQAQRAVEQLGKMGVSARNIDVARRRDQGVDVKEEPGENREWVGTEKLTDNNLIRFFKSLFSGKDDDMPDRYSRVASSGHAIVTVIANSRQEAESIADVLDDCGAINVDEHAGSSGQGSAQAASATPGQPPIYAEPERNMPMAGTSNEEERREAEMERRRRYSQIVDRPIEEQYRLRDENDVQRGDTDLDRNRPGTSAL